MYTPKTYLEPNVNMIHEPSDILDKTNLSYLLALYRFMYLDHANLYFEQLNANDEWVSIESIQAYDTLVESNPVILRPIVIFNLNNKVYDKQYGHGVVQNIEPVTEMCRIHVRYYGYMGIIGYTDIGVLYNNFGSHNVTLQKII